MEPEEIETIWGYRVGDKVELALDCTVTEVDAEAGEIEVLHEAGHGAGDVAYFLNLAALESYRMRLMRRVEEESDES